MKIIKRPEPRFKCRYCGIMCTARQLVCQDCRKTVKGKVMRLSKLTTRKDKRYRDPRKIYICRHCKEWCFSKELVCMNCRTKKTGTRLSALKPRKINKEVRNKDGSIKEKE